MKTSSKRASKESLGSYRSLLPTDDPVVSSAVRTSIIRSRASSLHNLPISETQEAIDEHPFRRWLTKLHERSLKRKKVVNPRQQRWRLNEFEDDPPSPSSRKLFPQAPLRHRKSSSWNSGSTALIAATRSAFISLSVLSEARRSVQDVSVFRLPRSCRSDRASASIEIDTEALNERARKRRQIIDEILHTESEYILSLKALDHLTVTDPLKSDMEQMQTILGQLIDLHHELAHALQNTRGLDRDIAGPDEAIRIALVFGGSIHRFFLYEEYASKYEEMLHNVGLASQNIPDWENYQKGFEMLSNSIISTPRGNLGRKKSLTFGDLHVKPIQRLCKYPLLFADLCKHTPVIDDPDAHVELEKVLYRLRDTVMEINQATINVVARDKIRRSWKLQDMLVFPDPLTAPYILRCLGPADICGALYIVYQSGKSIIGSYMLCALFNSYLVLALPTKQAGSRKYQVFANIALSNARILDMDDESGLQCITVPYAWKMVFELNLALFEILVVFVSLDEQEKWRNAIQEAIEHKSPSQDQFSMVASGISSIGEAIGKPGSLLRTIAMNRNIARQQVIIRNTVMERAGNIASVIKERMLHPILTPKRVERARIEEDIERTGCRETPKDHATPKSRLCKASASSLLRKLSRSNKMQENRST